ncbi:MAG: hypothetical protein AMJ75_12655 [Phycisphaerae bacterium SM1_79]|nr:MAG: hypothetical protein AMJ75_12655 [Phycisphaerae bacterium SM1_79]
MKKKSQLFIIIVCLLAMSSTLLIARPQQKTQEQEAKQILQTTGVKGGLVVHVGCGDGKLTSALHATNSYIVHGLDADVKNVEKAREHIGSLGIYGKVSVGKLSGDRLPYIDNLVNLIIAEDLDNISMNEIIAYIRTPNKWTKMVKPWPEDIDEWTHFLHDAVGNAVAGDGIVGPPRHMQWMAAPTWNRNHHTLASISAVVSAQGRLFYIVDEGPAASMEVPGKWSLVARDAFNGVLLWKQSISSWAWHRQKFRSGPVQLPRTLVAVKNCVYVPLGIDAPVKALDAATGEVIRIYQGTEGTEEVILNDSILLVVTGSPAAEQAAIDPRLSEKLPFPNDKSIVAFQSDTGEELWKWSKPESANPVPLTLAAQNGRVFFAAGESVLCLDDDTGKELWRSSPTKLKQANRKPTADQKQKPARKRKSNLQRRLGWSVATLVVHDGVVFWADGRYLLALSSETGKVLWSCPCQPGFRSPVDVFVAAGLVWLGPDFAEGRDPRTGEVKKSNPAIADLWTAGHHHRCYREKATDRYIITGKRGIEFLDLHSDNHSRNNWVRGLCQYGIMPCNGLIYAPSHACGCFMEAKLYGFWALAPESDARKVQNNVPDTDRLKRGPAYGKIETQKSKIVNPGDWPTHRRDPIRSGSTMMELPTQLQNLWHVSIGGRLSAPVIADGNLILSNVDAHRVVLLDARNGKTRWAFTAGGRVDSAPTIYRGLVLFGCADGWIYCLRLSDGEQVWRFCAAPEELKTVSLGQVESVWPVHGSVLVQDGLAYAAAGRSSYIDGGIFLYGLDPMTGEVLCQTRVRNSHPKVDMASSGENGSNIAIEKIGQNATDSKTFTAPDKSDAFSMDGATTDILVGDGTSIYMRHVKFDRNCLRQPRYGRHLFSTSRLLDDAEVHRSHWVLGTGDFRRIPVAYSWIANSGGARYNSRLAVPYGLLLAFDNQTVWGVQRSRNSGYILFADDNRPFSADEHVLPDFRKPDAESVPKLKWSVALPMRPRAMLRAGNCLYLGGMPGMIDQKDPFATYEGRKGGLLWVMSGRNGEKLAEYKLEAVPVWDGMAAANERLYISTQDGRVLSMGKK